MVQPLAWARAGVRIAAVWLLAALATPPAAAETTAWIELVQGGAAQVRAVVDTPACPTLVVDGRTLPMSLRAGPERTFPNRLCRATLPEGAKRAEILGRILPAPHPSFDRIIVLGDTGCRLKGPLVQNCNDPKEWPFAEVARQAATEHPDLVIHVGDYYYREDACPNNVAGCAGSPHGDAWPTWVAEFFSPAKPLLDAAPWVFARGNHESCHRGSGGYFRLLGAEDDAVNCPAFAPPFAVPLGSVTLHILDSADARDRAAPAPAVEAFRRGLLSAQPDPKAAQWIITHRPIWGLVPIFRLGPIGPFNWPINQTEQTSAKGLNLDAIQLIISGHIHHFASFSFGRARPAQLIVGTGGDVGESADTQKMRSHSVTIDGLNAKSLEFERYGYFLLERSGPNWRGTFKDVHGRILSRCLLQGRSLDCSG